MKTQTIQFQQNKTEQQHKNKWFLLSFLVACFFMCQFATAQTTTKPDTSISVKGMVYDDNGALPDANIILKDSSTGTVSDAKGAFTFPETLKKGDILTVSYLGYKTQNITITEASKNLNITLAFDELDVVLVAPNSDQPYRTKRKN